MTPSTPIGLSFVHIPKTGGTSIAHAIAAHALPIQVCDHSYPQRLEGEEFVVLRDPLQRFASALRYGQARWPNAVNASFRSANELAECAGDPAHPKHELAWTELGNRPEDFLARNGKPVEPHSVLGERTRFCWVYEPQSTWLANAPRHRLRQHCLDDDFAALLRSQGFPPVLLPRLNQSANSGDEHWSVGALRFLESVYAADFGAFHAIVQADSSA